MNYPYSIKPNDPAQAGKAAGPSIYTGPLSTFEIKPVHTRFESVQWFVLDLADRDDKGLARVIRQSDSFEAAVQGLRFRTLAIAI